jgi:UDP-3-O-[3-hydroxymyristoyl] glucosamine N-acyltransferase
MIIVIGTGAVAAELTLFFSNIKGYIEYSGNIEKYYNRYKFDKPVLGDIDSYNIQDDDLFVAGFADITFRKKMINKIISRGGQPATLIHDSAIVSDKALLGIGNVIYPQCIIGPNVVISHFNLLTCQSIVSHDCTVGNNNVLATTLLCGHTVVGDDNSFGIRSTTIPHITIGSGNVVQAGMIVDKNIKDNSTIFYKYKEQILIMK